MIYVDTDSLQFYESSIKSSVRSNERFTIFNLRISLSCWKEKDSVALEASQEPSEVPYNPNLIHSQNETDSLQKNFLDSFRASQMSLNDIKTDKEIASMFSEDVVAS